MKGGVGIPKITAQQVRQATIVTDSVLDPSNPPELLALFDATGNPIDPSGGGGGGGSQSPGVYTPASIFDIVSGDPEIELMTAEQFPELLVGAYLAKLQVQWGIVAPTTGTARIELGIIDLDGPVPFVAIEMDAAQLVASGGLWTKMDLGIFSYPGTFQLKVVQDTDQTTMSVSAVVWLALVAE